MAAAGADLAISSSAAATDALELSDWSDYSGDDDNLEEDGGSSYFNWSDELPSGSNISPSASCGFATSSSSSRQPRRQATQATEAAGGRPPDAPMDDELLRWLCMEGYSNGQIAAFFGATAAAVDARKRRLKLTQVHRVALPTRDELYAIWQAEPRTEVASVAAGLAVSCSTLRRHFAAVGFSPGDPHGYETVLAALQGLLANVDMRNVGVTFATGLLQAECGVIARPAHVRRALRVLDPANHEKRAKEASKTQYIYDVGGPRSLYHCDAHEKLAKIWGFWEHLGIDGYSRRILWLTVKLDKRSESVRAIFREACTINGWAARVRWDKGTENAGAIEEQLTYHHSLGKDSWRGCAITGRSMLNCRAEYIWNPYKRHVSGPYRATFFKMMRERGVLDVGSREDIFCLHMVFQRRIQESSDRFRRMWNAHRIRGPPCIRGHGGGIPNKLWLDPVEERVRRDDDLFAAQGGAPDDDGIDRSDDMCSYGVAEPFKGDTEELSFSSVASRDPLEDSGALLFDLLCAIRTAYFELVSFEWDREGIEEYVEYKSVCKELVALSTEGCWVHAGVVDFAGFGRSVGSHADSQRIRAQIAVLGGE